MNDVPRQALRQIIAKYGTEIGGDARRCEGLLNDLCGAHRREINVLVNAVEERVPLDLLAASRSTPIELLLTRIEKRLEEQTALTAEAASWAVESWALALDLTTENDVRARRNRNESAAPPIIKTEKTQPGDSADGDEARSRSRPNSRRSPTQTPVFPPPNAAPVNRRPPQPPKSPPPVISPINNPPANQPPAAAQPQQTTNQTPPTADRKSFGVFRGCLLALFLLAAASVALFFGVPYAIDVMRETQRQRNNEPPRFPAR